VHWAVSRENRKATGARRLIERESTRLVFGHDQSGVRVSPSSSRTGGSPAYGSRRLFSGSLHDFRHAAWVGIWNRPLSWRTARAPLPTDAAEAPGCRTVPPENGALITNLPWHLPQSNWPPERHCYPTQLTWRLRLQPVSRSLMQLLT